MAACAALSLSAVDVEHPGMRPAAEHDFALKHLITH
jgi:hypothetical protein